MTRAMWMLTGAVLASAASGVAAQSRPDFSGQWALHADPAPTPPAVGGGPPAAAPRAGDMGSGWGATLTIVQAASQLTVEYAFFARADLQAPLKFVYALDGTETRNTVLMGRGAQPQRSKTVWQGEKLVITTVHTFTDPVSGTPMSSDVQQTISLESPEALIVETTRIGVLGGGSTTTRTIYKKV